MKSFFVILAFTLLGSTTPPGEVTPPATQGVRFATLDVTIDPHGTPLAAWQVEVTADAAAVKLAGIEGGDHPAYREPAFYDPAALNQNRVILAAFNTSADLPSKTFRAARLHVQIAGEAKPKWEVKVVTAAGTEGGVIKADAAVSEGATP
jgi:hypothetical protein